MVDAAKWNNVTMATVHNYTFIPVYRLLKDVLDGGEIGALEMVVLNFLSVEDRPGSADYRPRWRHDVSESGGGVLMDILHAVYLAGWFFGADPVAVSATVDQGSTTGATSRTTRWYATLTRPETRASTWPGATVPAGRA